MWTTSYQQQLDKREKFKEHEMDKFKANICLNELEEEITEDQDIKQAIDVIRNEIDQGTAT